ncbi:MAG: hypothetical protein PHX04_02810 [Bacilli bacterium]|nr:hypothetical protein [Bacilli bacterium]
MNKNISLMKFIIFQLGLMLIIFFGYALILPKIKSACSEVDLCSQIISCDCENEKCICKYYDEDGKVLDIECPNNYLD